MTHSTSRRRLGRFGTLAGAALTLGLVLSGCSAAGGATNSDADAADLDAALEEGGALTYWTWTPSAEAQVAAFEKAYPNVDVNVVNVGTGTTEYTQLQNAITAGSGAPDVAQVEYFAIPQFALADSFVDLTPYGLADLEDLYSTGPWSSVSIGGGLYGLPQDSGPMAMFYNQAVFDQYGIEVPTTWDEYYAAAQKLHTANPDAYIAGDTSDPGFATSMIWQAGGRPFEVADDGTTISVDLEDEGSRAFAANWSRLTEGELLPDIPSWSDEWYRALGDGTIATLLSGAWMPGVLESSVPEAAGDWRAAALPTADGGSTGGNSENGGGGQVVLEQSENKALAAAFVRWLNSDDESIDIFLQSGGFPATVADLESDEFLAQTPEYFGGQAINEILVEASRTVSTGWQYLPFQVYANSVFPDTVGQSFVNHEDIGSGLMDWQDQLVEYGDQQGFSVNK
ncbi:MULTISPECIES: ABC transporter substrate-binding protein [unclassified Rathayibacter]|jgi:multiple sugar transport system substrate-binding protein|uniref:ABC transporter substrate-binding protein n=1 Tax=unclassified Rathayibacter TaxID=2609250 RepID=UPI000CE8752D|nr:MULTISPECIES: extracellular solute-binding protein [unclassified Rathayibacter]PPF48768.1 sugar ABC transporter substrate-binding protein [Rathayibacter sp. AY1A1]PPH01055.1 sugar ABC transporter substrate-binding protein [Rathayibacter sp. AY1G9]